MPESPDPIVVNGSHGEGGGALLRTALAMSAITQQPLRVHSIRGALRKAGITSEDLVVIRTLGNACAARMVGDELGETDLVFRPTRPPRGLNQRIDIQGFEKGTVPGNALVVLESLLPVLARTGMYSSLTVLGETHNNHTLTYDAFERTTLAAHRRQGLYAYATLQMAGFGFGSKGEVALDIEPSALQPIDWPDRGKLLEIRAVITLAELPEEVGEVGSEHLARRLKELGHEPEVEVIGVRSRGPGVSVTVWAEFERGFGLGGFSGTRGMRVEHVVENAWTSFMEWYSGPATVDSFLADQLLLPAVLAEGKSFFTTNRLSRRLLTMAWVAKQFLPVPITILGSEGGPGSVKIER